MSESKEPLDLSKLYVPEEERVLDPTLITASAIERLPQPTGWAFFLPLTERMEYCLGL